MIFEDDSNGDEFDGSDNYHSFVNNPVNNCQNMNSQKKPWVEKYRPKVIGDIVHHHFIIKNLQNSIQTNNLPHMLFYGPSGVGKTSTIIAFAKSLYGDDNYKKKILELNASDERGIKVIREKVKMFAQQSIKSSKSGGENLYKIIILDEADTMTSDAQAALRCIIEKYSSMTRFCLICNHVSKIIEPLASRCAKFRFTNINKKSLKDKLKSIIELEKVVIDDDELDLIINSCDGDLRKGINYLQYYSMMIQVNKNDKLEKINSMCGIPDEQIINNLWINILNNNFMDLKRYIEYIFMEGYSGSIIIELLFNSIISENKILINNASSIKSMILTTPKQSAQGYLLIHDAVKSKIIDEISNSQCLFEGSCENTLLLKICTFIMLVLKN